MLVFQTNIGDTLTPVELFAGDDNVGALGGGPVVVNVQVGVDQPEVP